MMVLIEQDQGTHFFTQFARRCQVRKPEGLSFTHFSPESVHLKYWQVDVQAYH